MHTLSSISFINCKYKAKIMNILKGLSYKKALARMVFLVDTFLGGFALSIILGFVMINASEVPIISIVFEIILLLISIISLLLWFINKKNFREISNKQ